MPLELRNYEDYALKKTVIKKIKRQGKFHKRTYHDETQVGLYWKYPIFRIN